MTYTVSTDKTSIGHMPATERWTFDESVANVFTDMLRRSIPQYDVMRRGVFDIGAGFVQPRTHIVDLGCAQGDAMAPFVDAFRASNRLVGVDVSSPMLEAAKRRFAAEISEGTVSVIDTDLRATYPDGPASLTLCVLTLQFTPIEHRQRILHDIFRNTVRDGAVILVEKVLGSTARLSRMLIERYHSYKASAGYSAEEIERKRLSLEGVLVPVTAHWNEEMLRSAGFQDVDCFWRWMNFAGWVAIKS